MAVVTEWGIFKNIEMMWKLYVDMYIGNTPGKKTEPDPEPEPNKKPDPQS